SDLEPVVDTLSQDRRCERAEGFAVLDLEVKHLLHGRRARVAQYRTIAESPRAKLHSALEPGQRLALRQVIRAGGDQGRILQHLEPRAAFLQTLLDLRLRERRSEVSPLHGVAVHPPLLAELHVITDQGGAQSAARITRGGLNVDLLEATVAQDFAVRHAVKGNPTCQAQVPDSGLLA